MRILGMALLTLSLLVSVSHAKTVAKIDVDEQITLPGSTEQLVLNGAGVRSKLFFKIYVAALYMPKKTSDPEQVFASETPKRMSMHFLYSEVSKKKMDAAWQDGFADNVKSEELGDLLERLSTFKNMFGDMREGDIVLIDYLPATGTRVTINGTDKGTIPGGDFSAALMKVWLGKEPVTKSLKKQLLGSK